MYLFQSLFSVNNRSDKKLYFFSYNFVLVYLYCHMSEKSEVYLYCHMSEKSEVYLYCHMSEKSEVYLYCHMSEKSEICASCFV